jgi:hypothetical protein
MTELKKQNNYTVDQLKELILCVDDIVMDFNAPDRMIKKLIYFVKKESISMDRLDVIENLENYDLIAKEG